MVDIDTERVRTAARGLRRLTAEPRDIAATIRTDAIEGVLEGEADGTTRLFGEVEFELGALGELYDARADLAIGADAFPSYEAYMAFQQAAIDRLGAAITVLGTSLTNGIGDVGVPFDFFGDLSEEAARELFEFFDAVGDEFAEEFAKLLEGGKIIAGAIPEVLFILRLFKLLRGKVPVITNSFLIRLLFSILPSTSAAVHIITKLAKAVRFGGGTLALVEFLRTGWDIAQQGWPWDAFEESGHDYIADLGKLGFYGTLAVLLYFPGSIKVTGPLAVAFAALWGTARYWEEISALTGLGLDQLIDVAGGAWDDAVDRVDDAWDATVGSAGDVFADVTDWAGDRVDDAREFGDDVIDFTEDRIDDIHDAGTTVVDTVSGAADRVRDIFEPDLNGTFVPSGPPQ